MIRLAAALVFAAAAPAQACPDATPPSQPFAVDGFYVDTRGKELDPARRAARDAAVKPYETFVRDLQDQADRFAVGGDLAGGRCAIGMLAAFAEAGVLAGRLRSPQAHHERTWYVGGYALAWLKVRGLADPPARRTIDLWLNTLAAEGERFYARQSYRNNLVWWSGFASAATGLATGDAGRLDYGDARLAEALAAVRRDGTLATELERGERALSYHAFAAGPIAGMALSADVRGHTFDREALARLVLKVADGMADPELFEIIARAPQKPVADWELAWWPLAGSIEATGGLPPRHTLKSHFFGGDVTATIAAMRRHRP